MQQKKRIDYIDIFRSFGIITMVLGHIGFGAAFDHFIHAFHMPMFFWISGFLFNPDQAKSMTFPAFAAKKAKTLLSPYFAFGLGHFLLMFLGLLLIGRGMDWQPLLHLLWVNTDGLGICGALWFLTALLIADLLFFLLHKYIPGDIAKAFLIGGLALFGNLTKRIFPFTLPYALGPALVGLGLYCIGYLCRKYEDQKLLHFAFHLPWLPNLILAALTTALIFVNGYINMRTETYATIPLFWINALLSVVVGVNFSKQIYPRIQNNWIGRWLMGMGRDSIVYVCLNQIVILVFYVVVYAVGLPTLISKILITLATFLALVYISKFFMNSKWKILMGRS